MFELDVAIQQYADLKAELEEHEQNEPIGLQYDKEDKYYWSKQFHEIWADYTDAKDTLNRLLDQQLDEYFDQDPRKQTKVASHWDKKGACLLLKQAV